MRNRGVSAALILSILVTLGSKISASPLEEVELTRHNLIVPASQGDGSSLREKKSCTVCHTDEIPWESHNADKEGAVVNAGEKKAAPSPLWDGARSSSAPYRVMQTAPLNEHPYNHPTGPSLVCLSCHDGALGADMHGINVGDVRVGASADVPFKGMSGPLSAPPLSRVDHPISIRYPRQPNGRFTPENPTVTLSRYWALPDRQAHGLVLPASGSSSYLDLPEVEVSGSEQLSSLVRTTGGMLECDSCHNPHSEKIRPFLRVPSATLCLVCHDR